MNELAVTLKSAGEVIPDDSWLDVPVYVMNSVGRLCPAQTVTMREDIEGNRVIILSTEPATPP